MLHVVQSALNLSCEQADDVLLILVVAFGVLAGRWFFDSQKHYRAVGACERSS
jgi:hypothetical protein